MIQWLKRLVAGPELEKLERWDVAESSLRKWLAEFPDVAETLDALRIAAAGGGLNEHRLRERLREGLRQRMAIMAPMYCEPPRMQPAKPFATDWDVAQAAQEPEGRVDYRFLGVMGDGQDS